MRVEQLGARLEAYVATLPKITTLRLCNRLGTGPDCYIKKLPIELVKNIEEHIVEPEREKALKTWSRERRCFEEECYESDHSLESSEELYQRYHMLCGCRDEEWGAANHANCGHGRCGGDKCPAWKPDNESLLEVIRQLEDAGADFFDPEQLCEDWQEQWRCKIGLSKKHGNGFFKKHQELLNTDFGIIVWPGLFSDLDDPNRYGYSSYRTTTHLTLPDSSMRHETWPYNERRRIQSVGMPVRIGSPPTTQSLSRFPRAFKVLGLQAWSHPGQWGKIVLSPEPNDAAASETDEDSVPQPQLTLLVRSKLS